MIGAGMYMMRAQVDNSNLGSGDTPNPRKEIAGASGTLVDLGRLDHETADVEALRAEGVTFVEHILPMIEEKCYRCHSYRVDKPKGKLRLDSPANFMAGADDGVLVPGKPDSSILFELCTLDPEDEDVMPPEGKGDVMTARQLAYLRICAPTACTYRTDHLRSQNTPRLQAAQSGI
jgi:hypothetical protein